MINSNKNSDTIQADTLTQALEHAARGWYVHPCKPDKTPYTRWKETATTAPAKIKALFSGRSDALIGIYPERSGFFVLDVDRKNGVDGLRSLTELLEAQGEKELSCGPVQQTPSGGHHFMFRLPQDGLKIPNNAGKLGPGLDLRSNGYICAGPGYFWIPGHGPDSPLTDAPAWLLDLVRALKPQPKSRIQEQERSAPNAGAGAYWLGWALKHGHVGNRNQVGYSSYCQMRDSGVSQAEAESLAREYAARVPGDGYTEAEALASVRSAYSGARREPAHLPGLATNTNGKKPAADLDAQPEGAFNILAEKADHEGHARCVHALHAGKFAYSDRLGWLAYTGKYYSRENAELQVERAIVKTLRARQLEAVKADLQHLVKACPCSRTNVTGTREQLKSLVSVSVDEFDANPDELNVNNGVLNLRTGQLTPHDRTQRFSYCVPVDYDPGADPGAWVSFLLEAVAGDQEVVDYLQLAQGYGITGHTWEEILLYIHGPTRSGKGTYTETLIRLLGGKPLATEVDFQTFTASREGDTQNFDLAPLKPCRFVAASESNKRNPLNPAKIKQLTGGNYVYCAYKHREHFSYRPQYKIWLSSNHPANVDVDDDAAWARVQVIEFPVSHLGNEDKALKARLAEPANLRGLLAWIVAGARKWYSLPEGLKPPESVKRKTQAQRSAQDFVQQFIDELCEADPESWTHSGALHQAYKSWCESNGVAPKMQNLFSQALAGKGYALTRKRQDGKLFRAIIGLKLSVTRDAL